MEKSDVEDLKVSDSLTVTSRRTVGLRDIPLVLFAPGRVFRRVEDVTAWTAPLIVLLTLVTLIGYAKVETGLINREGDLRVQQRIAKIEAEQHDVVERSELRKMYENQIKQGEFEKTLAQIGVVVAEPTKTLATALLIAAVFFGVVALTGKKAEWHTLLTICVYAGFVDVLRLFTTLLLMLKHKTLDVDTSFGLLVRLPQLADSMPQQAKAILPGVLSGFDPFIIWFWIVVLIGLKITSQLKGWRAYLVCTLCWLFGIAVRTAIAAAASSGMG